MSRRNLRRRISSAFLGLMLLAILTIAPMAQAANNSNIPQVNPTPPPHTDWLNKILGWTLYVGIALAVLFFIVGAIQWNAANKSGRGSADDAKARMAKSLVVLLILGSLTSFLKLVVGAF